MYIVYFSVVDKSFARSHRPSLLLAVVSYCSVHPAPPPVRSRHRTTIYYLTFFFLSLELALACSTDCTRLLELWSYAPDVRKRELKKFGVIRHFVTW